MSQSVRRRQRLQRQRDFVDEPASFLSPFCRFVLRQVSQVAPALASAALFRPTKRHCCPPPIVIDAGDIGCNEQGPGVGTEQTNWSATSETRRERITVFARWLAAKTMGAAGFHQLGSDFAKARLAQSVKNSHAARPFISRGSALPGTHNSGVALVEVTQADGPRLIVNNEEERFSGNKHTTEYPRASIDADGRDAARHRARYRRHRRLAHELGLPDAGRHARALGAGRSCRRA